MSATAKVVAQTTKTIRRYVDVEVEIDIAEVLEQADDQLIIDELNRRAKNPGVSNVPIETIYEEFRRRGDAPQCLRDFIYDTIGKILP
jgi:hypothetical protein